MTFSRPPGPLSQLLSQLGKTWDYIDNLGGFGVGWYNAEAYGLVGDDTTDNTAALRALVDLIAASGQSGAIVFQAAKYLFSSAATDTSASNAVIVLPKINNNAEMITISFIGPSPAPNPWTTDAGAILRFSNVASGACAIGVKNDQGNGTSNANIAAHNMASYINVVFENITVRLPANPTGTAVDLSRVYNPYLQNFRVDTTDFGGSGTNPNLVNGVPDVYCTEPTTSTSWGLKLPFDFVPSNTRLSNLTILGYYNGLRIGELVHGRSITIAGCKVGLGIEGATWPSHLDDVVIVSTTRKVKALGVNPDLSGITGANTNAIIYIDQLKVEDDPLMTWAMTVWDIDDSTDLLTGRINVFGGQSYSQAQPQVNSAANLHVGNLALFNGMRVDHWKAFTPTIAAGTGTFTTVSGSGYWRQIDVATIAVQMIIQITTNGTAAGHVTATIPVTSPNDWAQSLSARCSGNSLVTLGALLASNSNQVFITKYDGTYPGADGVNLHVNGVIRLTP